MKWSLQQLQKAGISGVSFKEEVDITAYITNVDDILRASPFIVSGTGRHLYNDRYTFDIHIDGVLYLECAVTLEEVEYPISIDTTEVFDRDDEEAIDIEKNTIDLLPVVWENILIQKPIRVTKD